MTKCVCNTDNCNDVSGGPGLYCTRNDFLPYVDFSLARKTVTVNVTDESAYKLESEISFNADDDYSSATNGTVRDISSVCIDAFPKIADSSPVSGLNKTSSTPFPTSAGPNLTSSTPFPTSTGPNLTSSTTFSTSAGHNLTSSTPFPTSACPNLTSSTPLSKSAESSICKIIPILIGTIWLFSVYMI
jgi:hypothetical protein